MVILVIAARLLVPLAIPHFPLPGILAALLIDGVDQTLFELAGAGDLSGYQTYDKALDVYYLTIAYVSTIRNWDDGPAIAIGRALWYYRLVGVVLFEYLDARAVLLVFPNTFEYYFIAVELLKVSRNPFALGARPLAGIAAGIWIFVKLPQEYWLHVARLDVTDVLGELLSGPRAPWVVLGLAGAGALVWLAVGALRRRLPPRAWPPTLSSDAQADHLGWVPPPDRHAPAAFFDRSFLEKVVLVTLVSAVFVQILPGTATGVLEVAVATTAIIALSTLLSQWLARHGITWASAVAEFVTMGAANVGIGLAVQTLVPGGGGDTPLGTFLFLIALLTLVVVLFDRFTAIDRLRPAAAPVPPPHPDSAPPPPPPPSAPSRRSPRPR